MLYSLYKVAVTSIHISISDVPPFLAAIYLLKDAASRLRQEEFHYSK
jgi:hypothetical protein